MTKIPKTFLRSVTILFTGTVFAQLLSYIAAPIISRQYLPEDTAYLGMFLRITALGAAIATARLELAFPLEKKDHHAFGIYRFSMRFSLLITAISLLLVLIYSGTDYSSLQNFLFLISLPVGIFLTAFCNQGSSWSLRLGNFKVISKSTIFLSFFTNSLKVIFGLIGGGFLSLIWATVIGLITSCVFFIKDFINGSRNAILDTKSKRTKLLILKNSDLYIYNLPHVFVDLARDLLVASVIWNCYGKVEFGSFDHAFKMLKLPVVFIGAAIGQVFFKKCNELIHDKKSIAPFIQKICIILLLLSIIPFCVIGLYGSSLFSFVFGSNWKFSGELASIMVPWFLLNFITSPISYIPILLNKQKAFFWINLGGTLSMLFIVSIPYWGFVNLTFKEMLHFLSITQAIFLGTILFWFIHISRK